MEILRAVGNPSALLGIANHHGAQAAFVACTGDTSSSGLTEALTPLLLPQPGVLAQS
jgi:hypothetical protein